MSPPPDDDDDARRERDAPPSTTTSAPPPPPPAPSSGPVALYERGPISSLPEEIAGQRRKDLFSSLDALQRGWTVELSSRGQGDDAVVDAVFYSPEGEKVGTFAAARRIALAASKKGGG